MEGTIKRGNLWPHCSFLLILGPILYIFLSVWNQNPLHISRKLVASRTIATREEFENWKKQLQAIRGNLKGIAGTFSPSLFYHVRGLCLRCGFVGLEVSMKRLADMKMASSADADSPATAVCRAKYGTRRFLTDEEVEVMQDTYLHLDVEEKKVGKSKDSKALMSTGYSPPLLYSFPGSGNTWTRLLIEYATGFVSGSLYNDRQLAEFLPGELFCSRNVSVVKAHPSLNYFSELFLTDLNSNLTVKSGLKKCARGGVSKFSRAIVLLRDPFDALWSEFTRRASASHIGTLRRNEFDEKYWIREILSLAAAMRRSLSTDFHQLNSSLPESSHRLYVRYEDLNDPIRRRSSLQQIVEFLRLPVVSSARSSTVEEERPSSHLRSAALLDVAPEPKEQEDRLDCAFRLADHRRAHRVATSPADSDASSSGNSLDKHEVWKAYPEIVCRIWMYVGAFATPFGYSIWNNLDCRLIKPYMASQIPNSMGERLKKGVSE